MPPVCCAHSRAICITMPGVPFLSGISQREARREMLEFLRQLHFVADEHERARALLVVLRDVLDRAHEHRIVEIGVEIEQHVDAGHGGGVDVLQQLFGLRKCPLRSAQIDVDAQQPFGHRPLENAPVLAALGFQRGFAHQLHDRRFFPAFDDHQRHARSQQGLQFSGGGAVGSQILHRQCVVVGGGHFNKTPPFGAVFPQACDGFDCHDTAGVHAYNSPPFRLRNTEC